MRAEVKVNAILAMTEFTFSKESSCINKCSYKDSEGSWFSAVEFRVRKCQQCVEMCFSFIEFVVFLGMFANFGECD